MSDTPADPVQPEPTEPHRPGPFPPEIKHFGRGTPAPPVMQPPVPPSSAPAGPAGGAATAKPRPTPTEPLPTGPGAGPVIEGVVVGVDDAPVSQAPGRQPGPGPAGYGSVNLGPGTTFGSGTKGQVIVGAGAALPPVDWRPGMVAPPAIQQPVLPSFVWGALYGFVIRSICCALSQLVLFPVDGALSGLLYRSHPTAGGLLLGLQFLVLAGASGAAMAVGAGTRGSTEAGFRRAYRLGRIFFWAATWYLVTAVGAVFVEFARGRVVAAVALVVLTALNIPLLVMARTILSRTRWVTGRP